MRFELALIWLVVLAVVGSACRKTAEEVVVDAEPAPMAS
jgi:hypothetical protein